ncbi:MAG TPA: hypothetical protein VLB85_06880 [Acidimicrobiia bacterium]|nr:hypothetical protein [Acidimicrobiia bacterium]
MRFLVLACVFLTACSGGSAVDTTTTTLPPTTSTLATSTTSTTAPPSPCPPAPYQLGFLPPTVSSEEARDTVDEPDEFTSMGGTHVRLWVNTDGETAIALVRGALPPQQFPADRGEVDVAGSRGVAGPYPDGRWVVAWFNDPGDRCDEYTMVFYPPVSPAEVEETLAGMDRIPG